MPKAAGVTRHPAAKLVTKEADQSVIADTLSAMIRQVFAQGPVKPESLRVSVETSTADPEFWQLRAGIHAADAPAK